MQPAARPGVAGEGDFQDPLCRQPVDALPLSDEGVDRWNMTEFK
jgi:hypothetical protein